MDCRRPTINHQLSESLASLYITPIGRTKKYHYFTDRTGVTMSFGGYQRPVPARLCGGGCGFYGTAENRGLCSKCYTDSTAVVIGEEQVCAVVSSDQSQVPVVKKGRCGQCKKKVGLLGFDCRCGDTFCGTHRHPQAHACGFDFKEAGKVLIQMENPVIKADKIVDRI